MKASTPERSSSSPCTSTLATIHSSKHADHPLALMPRRRRYGPKKVAWWGGLTGEATSET
jgi:hypothetical protein